MGRYIYAVASAARKAQLGYKIDSMRLTLKQYIYIGIAILIIGLTFWGNLMQKKYEKEKAKNERLAYNQDQLLNQVNDYMRLTLTQKEMLANITLEQDSLIRLLKIKPKQIERIVERVHFEIDTTGKAQMLASNDSLLQVIRARLNKNYAFVDHEGCFTFAGNVKVGEGLSLEVIRREYLNRSTEIAYIEREKKFLFIRYGKWKGKLFVDNECGNDLVKELDVIKKDRKKFLQSSGI